jgi:hypothetical protein
MVVFFLAAITKIDRVWLAKLSHFLNPGARFGVLDEFWKINGVHNFLLI